MKVKKIIKRILLTLSIFIVIFCLITAIALNFIFTPEKITPLMTGILNENLNAKVKCQSMELTFFSSFPHFGLKLKNGMLLPHNQQKNTKADTLVRFDECAVSVNARRLYFKHDLIINNLTISNAVINALMNKNGIANWDILKETAADSSQTEEESSFKINKIEIKKLLVNNTRLSYDDYASQIHVETDSLNVVLKASKNNDKIVLDTKTSGRRISFSKENYRFIKNLKADFSTKIVYTKKDRKLDFDKSTIKLNDVDFITEGHFKRDTVTGLVNTDVVLEMKVPSLKTLWETVPEHLIKKEGINIKGNADLRITSKGFLGKGRIPLTNIVFKIDKGELRYDKFPGEIRHLEANVKSTLNYDQPENSNLVIDHLLVEGTGVNLQGNGTVNSILKNPLVNAEIKGLLDLTTLKKKFPIAKDITAAGTSNVDITASFEPKQLMENNFSSVRLKGNAVFSNLLLSIPKDTIYLKMNKTELVFKGGTKDNSQKGFGKVTINSLDLKYKEEHNVTIAGLEAALGIKNLKDSVAGLKSKIKVTDLHYTGKSNAVKAVIKGAFVTAELSPKSTKTNPSIITTFTIDSAGLWQNKNFAGIKKGNYNFTIRKSRDKKWMPRGTVEFNSLYAYSPDFAIPLHIEHTKISIDRRAITLNNAHINFGRSDVTLTGKINNILARKSDKFKITAQLSLASNFIDANEIMKALDNKKPAEESRVDIEHSIAEKTTQPNAETEEKTSFKIPENIRFTFDSKIKKLHYGDLDLTDLNGLLKCEDGHLKLNSFELTTMAARLKASLHYHMEENDTAKADFDLDIQEIQMANISKLMPAMDSLFPMAKSFEGKARIRMQGTAKLDKNMNVVIPSVKGVAALEAHDLMVLDSGTYKELAKTLMFKDKEHNTISTLDVEMIIDKSCMEVLPALVEIDRYSLAVGGIQNLDMTYNYHISVLKSPLPFKTGVDIKGDLKDYNIGFSKAKYKYYFTDKDRLKNKADESIIKKKKAIVAMLEFN